MALLPPNANPAQTCDVMARLGTKPIPIIMHAGVHIVYIAVVLLPYSYIFGIQAIVQTNTTTAGKCGE